MPLTTAFKSVLSPNWHEQTKDKTTRKEPLACCLLSVVPIVQFWQLTGATLPLFFPGFPLSQVILLDTWQLAARTASQFHILRGRGPKRWRNEPFSLFVSGGVECVGKQEGAIQITCVNVFVRMYFLIFAGESVSGRRNGSWSRGKKMRGKRGGRGLERGCAFFFVFLLPW